MASPSRLLSKSVHDYASTAASSQNNELLSSEHTNKKDTELISNKIALGDKRLKAVLHMLMIFEDNCIVNETICSSKLRTFRGFSRGFLGKVLDNYEIVKTQHSNSLGLSILLLAAIKIGLTKKDFVAQVQSFARRKNISVDSIRKTKCYALVKQIIGC
jgi:hypothetical protein